MFMRFNTADLVRIPCRFIKERWGQMPNGQKPKTKSQMTKRTTYAWRDRHPEKIKERWCQNTNGQQPEHKWPWNPIQWPKNAELSKNLPLGLKPPLVCVIRWENWLWFCVCFRKCFGWARVATDFYFILRKGLKSTAKNLWDFSWVRGVDYRKGRY